MTIDSCFFCRPKEPNTPDIPISEWKTDALKYTLDLWKCCKKHLDEIEADIAKRPKVYVLKPTHPAPTAFVPKQGMEKPNFQDREPNNGELME